MNDRNHTLDPRRTVHLAVYLTPLETLRLDSLRAQIMAQPSRSALIHAIIKEWIDKMENKK